MPNNYVDGGLLSGPGGEIVLGIDPSLTGFGMTALCPDNWRYACWLYRSKQRGVERLRDISEWMSATLTAAVSSDFIIMDAAIEDTVLASYSAVSMGELSGTVRMFCAENLEGSAQYPLKVPPTVVKKYATNRGNAKKNEILLSVYKKWGIEFRDDNLADSYVLARICAQAPDTDYEKQVLEKLQDPRFRDPARV